MRVDAGAPRTVPGRGDPRLPARGRPNRPGHPALGSLRSAPAQRLWRLALSVRGRPRDPELRQTHPCRPAARPCILVCGRRPIIGPAWPRNTTPPARPSTPPCGSAATAMPGPCDPSLIACWRWPAPCCETRPCTMRIMRGSAVLLDPYQGPRDAPGSTPVRALQELKGDVDAGHNGLGRGIDSGGQWESLSQRGPPAGRPGGGSVATVAGPPAGGQIPFDKGWEVPSRQATRKLSLLGD